MAAEEVQKINKNDHKEILSKIIERLNFVTLYKLSPKKLCTFSSQNFT